MELGRRIPGAVVLLAGANAGDLVVTEGTQKVRDGMPVEVVNMPVGVTGTYLNLDRSRDTPEGSAARVALRR